MRRFKHKKRGTTYEMLGLAKMQISADTLYGYENDRRDAGRMTNNLETMSFVVYRSLHDDTLWVRPEREFFDGRFQEIEK
jgi:hypothetical protein